MSLNETTEQEASTEVADQNEGLVMRFIDCPLGTRFKYKGEDISVYVILSHYGNSGRGLIAKWEGIKAEPRMQQVFSAQSSRDECKNLEIIVVA